MAKKESGAGGVAKVYEAAREVFEKAKKDWGSMQIGGTLTPDEHAKGYENWKLAKVVWGEAERVYYASFPPEDGENEQIK